MLFIFKKTFKFIILKKAENAASVKIQNEIVGNGNDDKILSMIKKIKKDILEDYTFTLYQLLILHISLLFDWNIIKQYKYYWIIQLILLWFIFILCLSIAVILSFKYSNLEALIKYKKQKFICWYKKYLSSILLLISMFISIDNRAISLYSLNLKSYSNYQIYSTITGLICLFFAIFGHFLFPLFCYLPCFKKYSYIEKDFCGEYSVATKYLIYEFEQKYQYITDATIENKQLTQFTVKQDIIDENEGNYYQCCGWYVYMLNKFECGRVSESKKFDAITQIFLKLLAVFPQF